MKTRKTPASGGQAVIRVSAELDGQLYRWSLRVKAEELRELADWLDGHCFRAESSTILQTGPAALGSRLTTKENEVRR